MTYASASANNDALSQALGGIADVQGWLSDGQAERLWERAHELQDGSQAVEIGSYHGRSTIMLALGAPAGARIVAIDPHAGNDRAPQEWVGTVEEGEEDNQAFRANLERAGVAERVRHVRKFSYDALADVDGQVGLLYVDGAHKYGPARADIEAWGGRVAPGGTMLIHDTFSSVGVTLAVMRLLFFSRSWRYRGRSSSMSEYRREDLSGVEMLGNAARQTAQLPWFARNLVVKVAIRFRIWPLARLMGHRGRNWPY